jgi:hypothetical protein
VEIWFSILVRRLRKPASFTFVDELRQQRLAFIDYSTRPWLNRSSGPMRDVRWSRIQWQLKQEMNLRQAVLGSIPPLYPDFPVEEEEEPQAA